MKKEIKYLGMTAGMMLILTGTPNAEAENIYEGECSHMAEQRIKARQNVKGESDKLEGILSQSGECKTVEIDINGKDVSCYQQNCLKEKEVIDEHCLKHEPPRKGCEFYSKRCVLFDAKKLVHAYQVGDIKDIIIADDTVKVMFGKEMEHIFGKDFSITYHFPNKKVAVEVKDFLEKVQGYDMLLNRNRF